MKAGTVPERDLGPATAALIPAYNEEAHIGEVVNRTRHFVSNVLVIDDGSTDQTAALARKAGAEVLSHQVNQGKGAAIRTGFRHLADGPANWIILLDGDAQHLPEEIPGFWEPATRAKLIVGNRMKAADEMPPTRRMVNALMSRWISSVCGQPIPDTQCGFRLVHRSILGIIEGTTSNYDYETEMLILAAHGGVAVESVPVSTIYGPEKSSIRPLIDTFRFLKLMLRPRRKKLAPGGGREERISGQQV